MLECSRRWLYQPSIQRIRSQRASARAAQRRRLACSRFKDPTKTPGYSIVPAVSGSARSSRVDLRSPRSNRTQFAERSYRDACRAGKRSDEIPRRVATKQRSGGGQSSSDVHSGVNPLVRSPLLLEPGLLAHSRAARPGVLRGAKENRTPDLFHAMEALYQLSYSPETAWISECRARIAPGPAHRSPCESSLPTGRSNVAGQPPNLTGPPGSLTSSIV